MTTREATVQYYSPYRESDLELLDAEWRIAPDGYEAGYSFKAWLAREVLKLRFAIIETLEENRGLADGENCTMAKLKNVVNWE